MFAGRPAINGQLLVSLGITQVRRSGGWATAAASSSPQNCTTVQERKDSMGRKK